MIRLFGNALVILSAVEAWLFVAAYQVLTRGAWRRSEAGRHLMAFTAVIGAVLTLSIVRLLGLNAGWFNILRVVVFAGVPVVLGWRIAILVRAQHGVKERQ